MKKIMMLILIPLIFPVMGAGSVFDEAAKLYIDGKMNQARQRAELGLKQNPGDEKLRALLEKIKEQKQQNKKNSSNQDKSDKKDDKKEQNKQKQDKKQDQKKDTKQQDPQNKQGEQKPQKGNEQKQQQASGKKQKISREEAQRILNALRESEKEAQKKKPPIKVPARRKTDKDW